MGFDNVLEINLEVNCIDDVDKLLLSLNSLWTKSVFNVKVLSGGITNQLYLCQFKSEKLKESLSVCPNNKDGFVVRTYGYNSHLFINREKEIVMMQLLHKFECGSRLHARFNNGLIYSFIPGDCINENSVKEPHIYKPIIREMVKLHSIETPTNSSSSPINKEPMLFSSMQKFLNLIPDRFNNDLKQSRYMLEFRCKDELLEEIDTLKQQVDSLDCRVALCHNDLLLANIIYNKDKDVVKFIDYEYAAFNYTSYDIANHFNEYAGVETVDFSRCPNKDYQLEWIRLYLKLILTDGGSVLQEKVNKLYKEVQLFTLVSHLFWALWAVVQAEHSSIDFDFLDYGILRLKQYHTMKDNHS